MDVMVGDEEDNCKEGMILCSFQLMKLSDVPRIKDKGDFGPDVSHSHRRTQCTCAV